MAHALAGTLAPQRDDHPLAGRLQRVHVGGHRIEHVTARLRAFRHEAAALSGGDIDDVGAVWHRERRDAGERPLVEAHPPLRIGKVEPIGRQRLIGRARAISRQRLAARFIVVLDLREPFGGGVLGQRLKDDR